MSSWALAWLATLGRSGCWDTTRDERTGAFTWTNFALSGLIALAQLCCAWCPKQWNEDRSKTCAFAHDLQDLSLRCKQCHGSTELCASSTRERREQRFILAVMARMAEKLPCLTQRM